jgi:hypothetical protein
MATRWQKKLYFNNYFRLYEETDITVRELKDKLYGDRLVQSLLGITENNVDMFWEALMEGYYIPTGKFISSYSDTKIANI